MVYSLIPGVLGDSVGNIQVEGVEDTVWVRLRGNSNLVVQAYCMRDSIPLIFGLIIDVGFDRYGYVVVGKSNVRFEEQDG